MTPKINIDKIILDGNWGKATGTTNINEKHQGPLCSIQINYDAYQSGSIWKCLQNISSKNYA